MAYLKQISQLSFTVNGLTLARVANDEIINKLIYNDSNVNVNEYEIYEYTISSEIEAWRATVHEIELYGAMSDDDDLCIITGRVKVFNVKFNTILNRILI